MSPKTETQKAIKKGSKGFTDEEKAAMKARAKELKAEERSNKDKTEGEKAALEAIAAMQEPDHSMAKRLHGIIKNCSPSIYAKTWYGMPAYVNKEGKIFCYFRDRHKFNERYSQLGFNDPANLDDGAMWPVNFALKELTNADEKRIIAIVKKAAGESD